MSDQALGAALAALMPQLLTYAQGEPAEQSEYMKRLLAKSAAHNKEASDAQSFAIDARPAPQDLNAKRTQAWIDRQDNTGLSSTDMHDRNRLAMQDAEARDLQGPYEFIGPPQAQPWDSMGPEQRLNMDRTVDLLDKAALARGGSGRYHEELSQLGPGISEQDAIHAARYKMSKQGMLPQQADAPLLPLGSQDKLTDDAARAERQYNLLLRAFKNPDSSAQ